MRIRFMFVSYSMSGYRAAYSLAKVRSGLLIGIYINKPRIFAVIRKNRVYQCELHLGDPATCHVGKKEMLSDKLARISSGLTL